VKGHRENKHNFAPIARSVQEQQEEKIYGSVSVNVLPEIKRLSCHPGQMTENTDLIRKKYGLPFLATDRSLMNIPGVGKSLTFRVIGLTDDGRRILSFDHDPSRNHSPIIKKMGKVTIVESKSVYEYLQQLSKMGEDLKDYDTIYGYSIGETEDRMPIFEYPEYNFIVTPVFTNLKISKPAPDFELTET
jgi:lysine 2,3-aminomutase